MSNPTVSATVVFAVFAFLFVGALLVGAVVMDRRRGKAVREAVPERIQDGFADPDASDAHATEVHTAGEYDQRRDLRP